MQLEKERAARIGLMQAEPDYSKTKPILRKMRNSGVFGVLAGG